MQGDGLRIITDPYNPAVMDFQRIHADADIVIRCSALDGGHNYAEMIGGNPAVVTATDVDEEGITVKGLQIRAVQTQESLIHKTDPDDNGMYCFTVEGIRIAHLGRCGQPADRRTTGRAGRERHLDCAHRRPADHRA